MLQGCSDWFKKKTFTFYHLGTLLMLERTSDAMLTVKTIAHILQLMSSRDSVQ